MVGGTNSDANTDKSVRWTLVIIPLVVFLGLVFYILQPLLFPPPLPADSQPQNSASVADASAALRRQDYALAATLAREVLLRDPTTAEAYLVAGEAALKLGDVETALTYFQGVPKSAKDEYVKGLWSTGSILLYQAKLREAEAKYREVLELDPTNYVAHERLAFILGIEGRRWESVPHLLEPIRQGRIYAEPLMLLGTVDTQNADAEKLIQEARKVNPDDWLPLLGTAGVLVSKGKLDEAEGMLREILRHEPNQLDAHAMLGRIVVETGNAEKFAAWPRSFRLMRSSTPRSGMCWETGHKITGSLKVRRVVSGRRCDRTRIICRPITGWLGC